jgi:Peptidase family M1 domain
VRGVRASLRIARRAVRVLGRRLGAYDSTELDVVLLRAGLHEGQFAGMEYPELVFSLPIADVITHEVAHQWWYGLVGNNQFAEPWLDESFASYAHERLHPATNLCRPGRPYALVDPSRRGVPLDADMALFESAPGITIGEVVYGAGSCALQTLERRIGRARMTAFLRVLQRRHRHGVMTKTDVLQAIRDVAPRFALGRWRRVAHLR